MNARKSVITFISFAAIIIVIFATANQSASSEIETSFPVNCRDNPDDQKCIDSGCRMILDDADCCIDYVAAIEKYGEDVLTTTGISWVIRRPGTCNTIVWTYYGTPLPENLEVPVRGNAYVQGIPEESPQVKRPYVLCRFDFPDYATLRWINAYGEQNDITSVAEIELWRCTKGDPYFPGCVRIGVFLSEYGETVWSHDLGNDEVVDNLYEAYYLRIFLGTRTDPDDIKVWSVEIRYDY